MTRVSRARAEQAFIACLGVLLLGSYLIVVATEGLLLKLAIILIAAGATGAIAFGYYVKKS